MSRNRLNCFRVLTRYDATRDLAGSPSAARVEDDGQEAEEGSEKHDGDDVRRPPSALEVAAPHQTSEVHLQQTVVLGIGSIFTTVHRFGRTDR